MKKEEAVVFLQRLWKNKFKHLTTYRLIEHLFLIEFTIEHVETISFDSLVVFLRKNQYYLHVKLVFKEFINYVFFIMVLLH
jgi:hypothetical protein